MRSRAMLIARGFALVAGLTILAGLTVPSALGWLPLDWWWVAAGASVLAVVFRLLAEA